MKQSMDFFFGLVLFFICILTAFVLPTTLPTSNLRPISTLHGIRLTFPFQF
ncbi:MAG: hypothetical protein J6J21_02530 [Clostridia bacterium]|nr:hypothetical protein [Clostridia bacterium]